MRMRPMDPGLSAMLDEAGRLPDCAMKAALLDRAAGIAEALGDLEAAWDARLEILGLETTAAAPKFETLFLCLGWCLALSDREPERFPPARVLWQYKWAAANAPDFASVPRSVIERLVDDLDQRFLSAGWGRRAGLHKRLEICLALGEPDRADAFLDPWRTAPRDRGSDCLACEASMVVELHCVQKRDAEAFRAAKPIIEGRLSCLTIPHRTFGYLLDPLLRLGRINDARELFDRGRRLLAQMETGGATYIGPYIHYAARRDTPQTTLQLTRRFVREAADMASDRDRLRWFGCAGNALARIAPRDDQETKLEAVPELGLPADATITAWAARFEGLARDHAAALDRRNGNPFFSQWLESLKTDQ